ncbi:MerC family mercury resistance protein [Flammeovirga yaeyamensis]|uniref:MerC family mercury resistance protein n=1 Tax=Flammeovirga yaeyamensis TaxID=367791 RepID=A0AAX1N3Q4_9BACT|nr:MerC domain-containing protein [Flammeovirga yaeyamensis]MBB3696032.1 hypothetical protein [Flammeovirga yaeyamensis]NMF34718.1 MerC domain-containing protein [Flammeovirga yaeyamensis]QWG00453.1 MerC family mercury resistance protein [Flammeovirga yaeyamensis]
MDIFKDRSDQFGAVASFVCLVHCIATPLLFVAGSCASSCSAHNLPIWWKIIDPIFLFIAFVAIFQSTKNTSSTWMKPAMWTTWSFLAFIIINEKLGMIELFEEIIYIPAIILIVLHIYNRKYCRCKATKCCSTS